MKTVTLSIALALVATGNSFAATHALASDGTGNKIAVTFDQSVSGKFGNIDKATSVITDETKAIGAIAHFFGPTPKRVLVRQYSEYNALKQAAIKAGVTSSERIAQTEIIVVPEFASMFGVNNIDQYAIDSGLVSIDERTAGGLAYNDKVLGTVFADITARAKAGELKLIGNSTTELA